jgi:hypothetical protein
MRIIKQKFIFRFSTFHFTERPFFSFNPFLKFAQCKDIKQYWWLFRIPFFTKEIDLTKPSNEILNDFDKNTRYETLRAEKEISTIIITNATKSMFLDIVNRSPSHKNRININDIKIYKDFICFTACTLDGIPIIIHSYLIDDATKRCRLLHSVSLSDTIEDKSIRAMYGRANRFLHYKDILHFKDMGIITYDLGGYAFNTTDNKLVGINKFKDGFGGVLVEQSNYENILFHIAKKIIRKFRIK